MQSVCACATAALILHFAARGAAAETKWEITPYRVCVCIAPRDSGDWPIAELASLERQVADLAAAHLGPACQFTLVRAEAALCGEMLTRFDELTAERVFALDSRVVECDKVFLVAISTADHRDNIDVRELDVTTRQLGPLRSRVATGRTRLAGEALLAIVDAFSPLVELERADGNQIVGKLRGGALIDGPHSPLVVEPGAPLAAVLRTDDRLGRTTSERVTLLPLTVLSVVGRDNATVTCEIHSAARHRLGARASLRLSRYGLAVKPPRRETRLVLRSTGASAAPLADYELIEKAEAEGGVRLVGRTDARGVVEVAADDRPWRMLYVRQGEHLLARLPLVTGYEPEVVVPLANNDVRLRAEGFVATLKQQVIDTVARRQILASRLRQRIAAGDFDAAQSVLDELQRLASSREFEQRLQAARTTLVGDNARTQQHIDELFRNTRQSLARYLDPQEIRRLEMQLAQARRPR